MAYRPDPDLEFLGDMPSCDLHDLVYCLIYDEKGEKRYTESLSSNEIVKRYYPDHNKYWQLIAEEIQLFGADSLASLFRGGKGVLYKEILSDVCKAVDLQEANANDVEITENMFLAKVLKDCLQKMDSLELEKFYKDIGMQKSNLDDPHTMAKILQKMFRDGKFNEYAIENIKKLIKDQFFTISFLASNNDVITSISGPAMRITIPAVLHIACLRKKYRRLLDSGNLRIGQY